MRDSKVTVMMSTYNGQKYLRNQLDSILAQSDIEVLIVIRDDGSTDETHDILMEYSKLNNVFVTFGDNLGWKKSFIKLLNEVNLEKNMYYAFSDQDDIWKPNKLKNAVLKINKNKPMVYHSNVTIMDGDENVHGNRFASNVLLTSKMPESFLNGYGVGATMVFNDKMLELIHQHRINYATNHDAYVMALGNLLGNVVYDSNSYILYRRHVGTATGFGNTKNINKPTIFMRYKRYKNNPKNMFSGRARIILENYGDILSPDNKKILRLISNYSDNTIDKFKLLFSYKIKASGIRKTLQIKYRVLMNTL